MGRELEAREIRLLESGRIAFYYRPRVEEQNPEELDDVQRLLIVLEPDGRSRYRLIAVGRKRLPERGQRERFWGFVDAVLDHPYDMEALLAAQTYGTKTRGIRHLPAARPAGEGTYWLEDHDGHTHLSWTIESLNLDDPVVADLRLASESRYIVSIANPDPTIWGLTEVPDLQETLFDELEVHITIPNPFPPPLQSRFRGRRYAQLDTVDWLEHPGAEVIFIGE